MTIYSDRIDASIHISLFEYGLIRNPVTGKTIQYNEITKKCSSQYISFQDVKKELEEAPIGFYSFIGEPKTEVLNNLDNNYLTNLIHSLIMYNGAFSLYY